MIACSIVRRRYNIFIKEGFIVMWSRLFIKLNFIFLMWSGSLLFLTDLLLLLLSITLMISFCRDSLYLRFAIICIGLFGLTLSWLLLLFYLLSALIQIFGIRWLQKLGLIPRLLCWVMIFTHNIWNFILMASFVRCWRLLFPTIFLWLFTFVKGLLSSRPSLSTSALSWSLLLQSVFSRSILDI